MAKNGLEGDMYAEPTGENFLGNVVIHAKIYIRTIWVLLGNLLNYKDPLGFSKIVLIKITDFEGNLVNYFFGNRGEQTCQTIKHFNKEDPAKIFGNNKTPFISEKFLQKNKFEDSALEILEE